MHWPQFIQFLKRKLYSLQKIQKAEQVRGMINAEIRTRLTNAKFHSISWQTRTRWIIVDPAKSLCKVIDHTQLSPRTTLPVSATRLQLAARWSQDLSHSSCISEIPLRLRVGGHQMARSSINDIIGQLTPAAAANWPDASSRRPSSSR